MRGVEGCSGRGRERSQDEKLKTLPPLTRLSSDGEYSDGKSWAVNNSDDE